MERVVRLHLEKLPEGAYLATTEDIQGLLARGRTVAETLEAAHETARRLIEEQRSNGAAGSLPAITDLSDFAVFWQQDETWLTYFEGFPDYVTQADTQEELDENLKDLYAELTSGDIPGVRLPNRISSS